MASSIHSARELKDRMAALESTLRSRARSARFGASLTAVVGVLVVVYLVAAFYLGYTMVVPYTGKGAAKEIVDSVEGQLTQNLEPARKYLEDTIKDNAPDWAKTASGMILENIPAAREQGVVFAVSSLDQSMAESNRHAKDMVTAYIRQNEAKIKDGVQRLSSGNSKEADQFLVDLKEAFNKQLELDPDAVVKATVDFIDGLNAALTKTANDSGRMTQLQAMQREILMLVKRALMDHTKGLTPVAQR